MAGDQGRDGAAPGGGAPPPGSDGMSHPNPSSHTPNAPAAVPPPSFMAPPPVDPQRQLAANGAAMLQMMQMMSHAAAAQSGGMQPGVAAAMQGAYGQAALAAAFSNPGAFGAAMQAMQTGMFAQPPAVPGFGTFPNPLLAQQQIGRAHA